eukprot:SAG31_NODE_39728_length_286_cov_0.711230_1_plen_50_part_10
MGDILLHSPSGLSILAAQYNLGRQYSIDPSEKGQNILRAFEPRGLNDTML